MAFPQLRAPVLVLIPIASCGVDDRLCGTDSIMSASSDAFFGDYGLFAEFAACPERCRNRMRHER